MSYKIGSLFDGSGGFPLAGSLCGIEPTWASEIEPYPVAVTKSRFPSMKHLGSVTDINGAEVEPVDVITFGSPCQDLSVAGKRAGLKHEDNGDDETTRSGLFMEAVRIIKEMRKATNGKYPTFAVWENVPGAFSSNKGEDFRIVLEELAKIVEPCASIPAPCKNGWSYADVYMGDGWSIAYRVLDAQYWGVPQRRRRIYLVLDLAGQRAGKILFERDGLRGYFAQGRTPWQGTAADAQGSTGADDREGKNGCIAFHLLQDPITSEKCVPCMNAGNPIHGQCSIGVCVPIAISSKQQSLVTSENVANTLGANDFKEPQAVCVKCYESHPMDSRVKELDDDVSPTVSAKWHKGAADTPLVCTKEQYLFENHSQDTRYKGPLDVSPMLPAQLGTGGNNTPFVVEQTAFVKSARARSADDATTWKHGDVANTLNTFDMGETRCNELVVVEAKGPSAVCVRYIVRRLTPIECARLQGFPDWWGEIDEKEQFTDEEYQFWLDVRNTHAAINGKAVKDYTKPQMLTWYNKLHTDSSEYKMWGNGIALPCALYVMQGIAEALGIEERKEQA